MYQGKRNKKYISCIIVMLFLLLIAAFGPQLLFAMQDSHIQKQVLAGERDRMDLTALNAGYTKVLRERLANYAEGLQEERKYYTAVTECKKDAECYSILENVLNREWLTFLNDIGLIYFIYDSIHSGYTVEEWKRYVIYDAELENGVAIMAWYFLITIDENIQMKLLVDVEDDTIYQLQIISSNEKYYVYFAVGMDYEDIITVTPLYWFYYYDAGDITEEMAKEYLESFGYDVSAEVIGKYDGNISTKSYASYTSAEYSTVAVEQDYMMLQKELPYGEYPLYWEMKLEQKEYQSILSMGISSIAEMVPEFSEN